MGHSAPVMAARRRHPVDDLGQRRPGSRHVQPHETGPDGAECGLIVDHHPGPPAQELAGAHIEVSVID